MVHDDLVNFVVRHIPSISDGTILVVTSKIVALSQGAIAPLAQKKSLIRTSARAVIETPWAPMAFINNEWCINAGIDESNAADGVIALPHEPMKTARALWGALKKKYCVRHMGILITDTRSVPLRKGTIGRALGFAGFEPFKSYIGKKDLHGRISRLTEMNLADALAAAAVLVMGEGDEQTPLAIIKDAPVRWTTRIITDTEHDALSRAPHDDLYAAVFRNAARAPGTQRTKKRP